MCELEQLVNGEVVLTLTAPGHFGEAIIAMDQYFRDEFGVEPELWDGGGLFEIVAVPEDVAGCLGADNGSGLAAEYGQW